MSLEERLAAIVALLPPQEQVRFKAPRAMGESTDTRLVESVRVLARREGFVCMARDEFARETAKLAVQHPAPATKPPSAAAPVDENSTTALAALLAEFTGPREQTAFWRSLAANQRAALLEAEYTTAMTVSTTAKMSLTPLDLDVLDRLTPDDWRDLDTQIGSGARSMAFVIGDWLVSAETGRLLSIKEMQVNDDNRGIMNCHPFINALCAFFGNRVERDSLSDGQPEGRRWRSPATCAGAGGLKPPRRKSGRPSSVNYRHFFKDLLVFIPRTPHTQNRNQHPRILALTGSIFPRGSRSSAFREPRGVHRCSSPGKPLTLRW